MKTWLQNIIWSFCYIYRLRANYNDGLSSQHLPRFYSQDDSLISYRNYNHLENHSCCERCRGREYQRTNSKLRSETIAHSSGKFHNFLSKDFRKRESTCLKFGILNSERKRHLSGEVPYLCSNWISYLRAHKMTRTIAKCIVFIVLASCFGYLFGKSASPSRSETNNIHLGGPNHIYMVRQYHKFLTSVNI